MFGFYTHILLGGISLMIGWPQFITKFRNKKIKLQRKIGKVYILSVLLSGITGLGIAFFATGGVLSKIGFLLLSILWLFTVIRAYQAIKSGRVIDHEKWMIINYSLTFAAVTLRLWLPILIGLFHLNFSEAYQIVPWLSWVPNLAIGYWLSTKIKVSKN